MSVELTAEGQGYYRVFANDVQVSKHTQEREAAEKAVNIATENPKAEVYYNHTYKTNIKVNSTTATERSVTKVYVNDFQLIDSELDDTGRIERAIDECISTGKKKLIFDGNYVISSRIAKTISNLYVEGNSSKVYVNIPDDTGSTAFAIMISGNNTGTFRAKDLTFESVVASTRLDLEKSTLWNFGCTDFDCIQIDNFSSTKSHMGGIFIGNCNRGYVSNCRVDDSRDRGIQVSGANNFVIGNNHVTNVGIGYARNRNMGYAITCSQISKAYNDNTNITIKHNVIEGAARNAIDCHNVNYVCIDKNVCHNFENSGIQVVSQNDEKECSNAKVTNNFVYNDTPEYNKGNAGGIVVGNSWPGFEFGSILIQGNTLVHAHAYNQITIHHTGQVSDLNITNNSIRTDRAYWNNVGIMITGGVSIPNAVISNNIINMGTQGICMRINDIDNLMLESNTMYTYGNKSATWGIELTNIKQLVDNSNMILTPRMPSTKRRDYTNVTLYQAA